MEVKRNNSKKRQAVLAALCASKEHPTAEMLYNKLKADFPELSLGTVYRNLSVLVEDGSVITIGKVDGQERYDAITAPHAHFICRGCGRVFDLDVPVSVDALCGEIDRSSGFRCDSISLSIDGLCNACLG